MALWFDLMVNDAPIGRMIVTRITPLGEITADTTATYRVQVAKPDGMFHGDVQHRFGDGAWELVRKVIETMNGDPHK